MIEPFEFVFRSEEIIEEIANDEVVAFDPVALTNVKFCKVEEPRERMFEKVPSPVEVMFPPFAVVKKRLVEEAVVEKKDVVVAEVPVAFRKVKF